MTPFNAGYFGTAELRALGFDVGENVSIAKNCTIIGLGGASFRNISIGNNVRIDGFTTIAAASGHLTIGSYVHIGGYCFLACSGGVTLEDFSGLSQRVAIYSASDDYSGAALTNPTIPQEYLNVKVAAVRLCRHVIIGSGSVILPGVTVSEGTAVGAIAVVHKSLPEWSLFAGNPIRRLKSRSKALLEAEERLLSSGASAKPR
jgi:galactoside O-acetyltransferase